MINNHDQYLHDTVNYYSDLLQHYAVDRTRKALSVCYYKNDPNSDHDDDTNMEHKKFNNPYFAYHFTPVVSMDTFQPVVDYNEDKHGFSHTNRASLVISVIGKPVPNDLIQFYIDNTQGMQDQAKELYKVVDVQFLRTSGKLNLVKLEIETSGQILDEIYVPKSSFYFEETKRFYPLTYIKLFKWLMKKEYIENLDKYYHATHGYYADSVLTPEVNMKLNRVLLWVKENNKINNSGIRGIFHPKIQTGFSNPFVEPKEGIDFKKEDVWYTKDGYVPDTTKEWDFFDGKEANELAKAVWDIAKVYAIFYKNYDVEAPDKDIELEAYLFNDYNKESDYLKDMNETTKNHQERNGLR